MSDPARIAPVRLPLPSSEVARVAAASPGEVVTWCEPCEGNGYREVSSVARRASPVLIECGACQGSPPWHPTVTLRPAPTDAEEGA